MFIMEYKNHIIKISDLQKKQIDKLIYKIEHDKIGGDHLQNELILLAGDAYRYFQLKHMHHDDNLWDD